MQFANAASLEKRPASELLIIPFWQEKKKAKAIAPLGKLDKIVKEPLATEDFKGEVGEITLIYHDDSKEKRVILLGLGDKDELTVEDLRKASGKAAHFCHKHRLKKVCFLSPTLSELTAEDIAEGVSEGFLLSNYTFEKHKKQQDKAKGTVLIEKLTFIGSTPKAVKVAEYFAKVAEGVYLTRDLINGNADDITPQYLAKEAKSMAKKSKKLKVTVLDKKAILKNKLGLIEAVSRGGPHDPVLIIMEYTGNPKSKDRTILVGKGITYDTGGLNLKPTGSMETMKSDMSGAAAVIGTMQALINIQSKANVTVVVPSTENAISDRSYKPGDVYTSYAGTTVEIGNTDAEGRLILADALAYSVKNLKPSRIVDIATLTGAVVIALGSQASGLMSNNDALADSLIRAGSNTYERLWRLPLFKEYRKQLDSKVADISNVGGRAAGTITAGYFLKEFVNDVPWAHLDIAGTAFMDKAKGYVPQHATGFGVRLLVDFIQNL